MTKFAWREREGESRDLRLVCERGTRPGKAGLSSSHLQRVLLEILTRRVR